MKKKNLLEDVTFEREDSSVDDLIDRLIQNAERIGLRSMMQSGESDVSEALASKKMSFIFEEENKISIDVGSFTNEILRCLMMYEKVIDIPGIIDIPGVIVKRTQNFLKTKYGEDVAKEFTEILSQDQVAKDMISDKNVDAPSTPQNQPLAVGATGGSSGGAA